MKYLFIQFLRKPNGQIDEQISIGKKMKTTDQQTCNVILNYAEKKVEKCVIEGNVLDTDWDKMNNYYKKIYPNLIEQLEQANVKS